MNNTLSQIQIFLFILFPAIIMAQENERFRTSFYFGVREIAKDSMPDKNNIDFMNYIHTGSGSFDEQYAGIGMQFKLNRQWEFEVKVSVLSDLVPSHFDLNSTLLFSKYLGLNLGLFTYPVYIENYNFYHINNTTGYIGDINSNFRQRIIHEWGIKSGASFKLDQKRFHGLLNANVGMTSFSRFNESIAQKKNNANLRREFRYATHFSRALFFNPEIEAGFDCFKLGNAMFGAQFKANLFFTRQAIDYTRTVYYWTEEMPEKQRIKSPEHSFLKYDADLGFYCRF